MEADVRMALSRGGYVWDSTISAVPASLRTELEALRDTGAPTHGAVEGSFAQPVLFLRQRGQRTIRYYMDDWLMVWVPTCDGLRRRSSFHVWQKDAALFVKGCRPT